MTTLQAELVRRKISSFIDSRIKNVAMPVHTAIVTEWTTGVELKVKITSLSGNPELSWKDGELLVLKGQTFSLNDKLILLPVSGVFFVVGELASVLP